MVNRDILVKFISSGDQIADVFTKGLSSPQFLYLKPKLMVVPAICLRGAVKVCNKEVAEDMVHVPTHQPHAIMECTATTHVGKERSVAAIKDDTTTLQHMKELP